MVNGYYSLIKKPKLFEDKFIVYIRVTSRASSMLHGLWLRVSLLRLTAVRSFFKSTMFQLPPISYRSLHPNKKETESIRCLIQYPPAIVCCRLLRRKLRLKFRLWNRGVRHSVCNGLGTSCFTSRLTIGEHCNGVGGGGNSSTGVLTVSLKYVTYCMLK